MAGSRFGFVYLEDVIKDNLKELFPDNNVLDVYVFRVIRDTDLVIQEDEAGDLLENVDRSLKQLRYGNVSLLQVEDQMPEELLQVLMENFEIFFHLSMMKQLLLLIFESFQYIELDL